MKKILGIKHLYSAIILISFGVMLSAQEVEVVLSPDPLELAVGEIGQVSVTLVNPDNLPVNGIELYINFDPEFIEMESIDDLVGWDIELLNEILNDQGQFNYAAGHLLSPSVDGNSTVIMNLNVKALKYIDGTPINVNTVDGSRKTIVAANGADVTGDDTPIEVDINQWCINMNGPDFVTNNGRFFAEEQSVSVQGGSGVNMDLLPIENTMDDVLYQTARQGDFSFSIPMPFGSYDVSLFFAELNEAISAGDRLFQVTIEGNTVLDDFDVFSQAGGTAQPYVFSENVGVADGFLNISLQAESGSTAGAILSAICTEFVSFVLPVQLISFEAEVLQKDDVRLNWSVANEINFSHYEIQRSLDAVQWEPIGSVPMKQDVPEGVQTYTFIDETLPQNGRLYYRLHMVDLDGSSDYSEIRHIDLSANIHSEIELEVYPNPTTDWLLISGLNDSVEQLSVSSQNGKILRTWRVNGDQSREISVIDLIPGSYYLHAWDSNQSKLVVKKIIIQ